VRPDRCAFGLAAHGGWPGRRQILTNGETAPLPPPDPPAPLDFGDLATGDTHTRALRVTSLADGMVEARIPPDSPFQVLSMTVQDGVILELPTRERSLLRPGALKRVRAPEIARQQPPWQLPVRAGQDVDVVVGLPVGAAVPPGGNLSATITVGDALQGAWRQDVPILAVPALKGDIRVTVATLSLSSISWPTPPSTRTSPTRSSCRSSFRTRIPR